jgi:hypothetical protein
MREVVSLLTAHKAGEDLSIWAAKRGHSEGEFEGVLGEVARRRRGRVWRDWEATYERDSSVYGGGAEGHEQPVVAVQREHGLSPVAARLFVGRLREVAAQLQRGATSRRGDTIFFAISADEGARAQLDEAKLVAVRLRYFIDEDLAVGPRGRCRSRVSDLKFARILRYTTEARACGALLTLPDLAMLLGIHVDAIRRSIAAHPEVVVPTRGRIKDIGRGVTHRQQIVEMYLQMHTETEIVDRTSHSYESVEAYLREFARVVTLADRGMNAVMIRRVTGRSMALVAAYLALYRKYDEPEYLFRLAHIRRVFAKEQPDEEGNKKKGSSPTEGSGK